MPPVKGRSKTRRRQTSKEDGLKEKRTKHLQGDTSSMSAISGMSSHGGPVVTTTPLEQTQTASVAKPPPVQRIFNLHTGKPLQVASNQSHPPSSIAVAPVQGTQEVSTDHESKTWFEACQRIGRMDSQEMLSKDINAYVRHELFPKLKFIMNNKQLNYSSEKDSICAKICRSMGLVEERAAVSWWERYKDMIADVLNMKRADVTGAMKRTFLREVAKHKKKGERFFSIEEFRLLSPSGTPYQWLCSALLPCVVGSKVWNKKKYKLPISDIATCSDETFVLLTLENNYERWLSEAQWLERNKDKEPQDREVKTFADSRFTNSGKSKQNGRSKRLQGWAREGYLLFNELHKRVANDRLRRANFESELMAQLRIGVDGTDTDSEEENEEEEIFPAHDLEGVVASVSVMVAGSQHETEDQYDPYNHHAN